MARDGEVLISCRLLPSLGLLRFNAFDLRRGRGCRLLPSLGLLRFCLVTGVKTNKEIAQLIGLNKDSFAQRKTRDSFPEKELDNFCYKFGYDASFIKYGISDSLTDEQKENSIEAPKKSRGVPKMSYERLDKYCTMLEAENKRLEARVKELEAMLAPKHQGESA